MDRSSPGSLVHVDFRQKNLGGLLRFQGDFPTQGSNYLLTFSALVGFTTSAPGAPHGS